MNQEEINKQILERLGQLEKAVFATKKKETKNEPGRRTKSTDLNMPISKLHKEGFFKNGRTDVEVCQELHLKLMTSKKPLRSSVVNVLRSMVKKGLLNRDKVKNDKKVVLSYRNVQSQ